MTDISVSSPDSMAFSITGQNNPSGTKNTGTVIGTACTTDWVSIPCATNTLSPTAQSDNAGCVDRLCGMVFNSINQPTAGTATQSPVNSKYHAWNSDY